MYFLSVWRSLAALEGPQEEIIKMKEEYNLRRKFCMRPNEIGFTYGDPGGAFYIYTNVSKSGLSARFCKSF